MALVLAVAGVAAVSAAIDPGATGAGARSVRFIAFAAVTFILSRRVAALENVDGLEPVRFGSIIVALVVIAAFAAVIWQRQAHGAGLGILLVTIIGAACEEAVFRVELPRVFFALDRARSPLAAIVVSQVAFVLAHLAVALPNPSRWVVEGEWLFVLGCAFAALYVTAGLVPAVAAHAVYNLLDPRWLTTGILSTTARSVLLGAASLLIIVAATRARAVRGE